MARSHHSDSASKNCSMEDTASIEVQICAADERLAPAGLAHSRHRHPGGAKLRLKQAGVPREELTGPEPTPRMASNGVNFLPVPGWDTLGGRDKGWLWNGFSTRIGGVSTVYAPEGELGELNLGFTADDACEAIKENRRRLAEAVTGSRETPLAALKQIHSNRILVASRADLARPMPPKADGLLTDEPGLLIGVQTADCIPVLVADRRRRAVGAFHAGWRGTVARIVECGVGRMRMEFGSRPEDLVAAIGPGVGLCCYAVGEEVRDQFESQFAYAAELFQEVSDSDPIRTRYPMLFLTQRAPGHSPIGPSTHLNLVEANRRQLLDAGLKPGSIQSIGGCTSCHQRLFFSYRASGGRAGRMLAVIGIRP
jgi:hypothetical protein